MSTMNIPVLTVNTVYTPLRARRRARRDGQTVRQRPELLSTTWLLRSLAKSNVGAPLQFREDSIVDPVLEGCSSQKAFLD
jgi:hypothetical protein